jgi:hypothetical protein
LNSGTGCGSGSSTVTTADVETRGHIDGRDAEDPRPLLVGCHLNRSRTEMRDDSLLQQEPHTALRRGPPSRPLQQPGERLQPRRGSALAVAQRPHRHGSPHPRLLSTGIRRGKLRSERNRRERKSRIGGPPCEIS